MFNKNRDSHGKNATLTFQHLCCLILIFIKPADISNPENDTDVTPNVNHKFEGCSFDQGRTTATCNIKMSFTEWKDSVWKDLNLITFHKVPAIEHPYKHHSHQ